MPDTINNNLGPIAESINQILTIRGDRLDSYERPLLKYRILESKAKSIYSAASKLSDLGIIGDPATSSKMHELIAMTDKNIGLKSIANSVETIENARERCKRDCLNVGILAPWRHGKSKFLEGLFNLCEPDSEYLIPTSEAANEACTGTNVNYVNDCNTRAEFEYFEEKDILEAIHGLMVECGLDVPDMPLRDLISYICENHNNLSSKTVNTPERSLWEYVVGYDDYKDLLSSSDNEQDEKYKVIKFALNSNDSENLKKVFRRICFYSDKNAMNDHNHWECLAVKSATIYMPLISTNNQSLGQIRFIDTPGLGEKRKEIANNIRQVLANDVDIVLVVCLTSKYGDNTHFNAFNSFLCNDFNFRYTDVTGKEKDASQCVHYILNVDQRKEEKYTQHELYKAERQCITDSLSGVETSSRINVLPGHLHYCDFDKKELISITNQEISSDGLGRSYYTREQNESACMLILESCLSALENDILDVDSFFNRKADGLLPKLNEFISRIGILTNSIPVPKLSTASEAKKIVSKIHKKLEQVSPNFSNDDKSEEALSQWLSHESWNIVADFLHLKVEDLLDKPNWNDSMGKSTFDEIAQVREEYKTNSKLLPKSKFDGLEELSVYAELKSKFRGYFGKGLRKCLDEEGLKLSFDSVRDEIFSILYAELKSALPADTTQLNLVNSFTAIGVEDVNALIIASYLKELTNVDVFNEQFTSYYRSLKSAFHKESIPEEKSSDELLFNDLETTRKTFIDWLNDICYALCSILKNDTTFNTSINQSGKMSFSTLLENIHETYNEKVLGPFHSGFDSIQEGSNIERSLGDALLDFVHNNISVLGDFSKKEKIISEWADVKSEIIKVL